MAWPEWVYACPAGVIWPASCARPPSGSADGSRRRTRNSKPRCGRRPTSCADRCRPGSTRTSSSGWCSSSTSPMRPTSSRAAAFTVPPESRWKFLADNEKADDRSGSSTTAMDAVMAANPALAGNAAAAVPQPSSSAGSASWWTCWAVRDSAGRAASRAGPDGGGVRVLPRQFRPRGRQAGRRILHPAQRRAGDRRGPRTVERAGVRPVLRLGRDVRADREFHRRTRRRPQERLDLRPGERRADLANGEAEPGHSRDRRHGPGRRWSTRSSTTGTPACGWTT